MIREVATEKSHFGVRPEWLALHDEPVIDPDRLIIDPHHHLWRRPESYFAPADLVACIKASGHRIAATVLVDGHDHYRDGGDPLLRPVGEVEHAVAAAKAGAELGHDGICEGIVAYADLGAGTQVGQVLDLMQEIGGPRFKGIRFNTVSHEDPAARGSMFNFPPGVLLSDPVRAGLRELSRRGLSFDGWMYHTQLAELAQTARDFPDLTIVLDHLGGPLHLGPYRSQGAEMFAHWSALMAELAKYPNIAVKLGGFGMKFFGFDFHLAARPPSSEDFARAISPYLRLCLDLFGPERCLFESNFPVDQASLSARVLWNGYKRAVADLSESEKDMLFHGTAARVYRLAGQIGGKP